MENGKKPAFAVTIKDNLNPEHPKAMGLTKREYFAAMAMQGLLASCPNAPITEKVVEQLPVTALLFADALLVELDKTKSE